MDTVKLRLTSSQLKNLQEGRSFQLSNPQLSGQSKGEHEIEIQLPSHHTKKLMKNLSMGKGFRFPAHSSSLGMEGGRMEEIEGGRTYLQRLASRTRNTFRPVERAFRPLVKPAFKELKNIALPIVKDAARDVVRDAVTSTITSGVGGNLLRGASRPLYTQKTTDRIMTHGLSKKMVGNRNGLVHGGSFLPLG